MDLSEPIRYKLMWNMRYYLFSGVMMLSALHPTHDDELINCISGCLTSPPTHTHNTTMYEPWPKGMFSQGVSV